MMWLLSIAALAALAFFSLSSSTVMAASTSFRMVTWNLRFDSMPNNITVQQSLDALPDPMVQPAFLNLTDEQPWSTRRIKVAQRLLSENIVLAGFQEALVRQVTDLAELLGSDFGWVGVGRDDGVAAGEFSPIFYKKSVFELLSNDTFWLSNTPFVAGSKFPGAGSVRIATATHFRVKATGKTFAYINTHLDDQSDDQRRLGASLILWRAHFEAAQAGGHSTVLITGDFNSGEAGDDSGAYTIITGQIAPVAINATFEERFPVPDGALPGFKALDLREQVPRFNVSGNWATFTGFNDPDDTSDFQRIDFVFGGSNGGWTGHAITVESTLTDDGVIASDHRPVFGDISL
ncbi:mannose-6-phosphatase [Artomyces pyxidatus]|uniref:Mannose-6-phosphatase n=1 Tax=Artomyces pyxidatus TaxID=48021 RepID=A0ACB8SU90_9AGAM|nr:mannose-6-phosphatase [Artomyces pyxidatus]